jgi:hypothetical protein
MAVIPFRAEFEALIRSVTRSKELPLVGAR